MATIYHILPPPSQFLLGGFYYIEAVVLLEDFIDKVPAMETNGTHPGITYFSDITYYNASDITSAYRNAA